MSSLIAYASLTVAIHGADDHEVLSLVEGDGEVPGGAELAVDGAQGRADRGDRAVPGLRIAQMGVGADNTRWARQHALGTTSTIW